MLDVKDLKKDEFSFLAKDPDLFRVFLSKVKEATQTGVMAVKDISLFINEEGFMEMNVGDSSILLDPYAEGALEEKMIDSSRSKYLQKKDIIDAIEVFKRSFKEGDFLQYVVRGEKIRSFLSKDYKFLDQEKLFQFFLENIPKYEFEVGIFSHMETYARVTVLDDSIMEDYELIAREKLGESFEKMVPILEFYTSDIGMRSAQIIASLKNDRGVRFPLGNTISHRHVGEVSEEDFKKSVEGVFSSIKELSEKVTNLFYIEIKNPLNCIINAAKKCSLNKEETENFVEMFGPIFEEEREYTAYDVYSALNEIVYDMSFSSKREGQEKDNRILSAYENVRRILDKEDWKKFDKTFSNWF